MVRQELEQALLESGDWDPSLGFVCAVHKPGRRGWVTVHKGVPDSTGQDPPLALSSRPEYVAYQDAIRERPFVVTSWEADDSDEDGWQELLSIETEEDYFADLDEVEEFLHQRFNRSISDIGWLGGLGREPGTIGQLLDMTQVTLPALV